MGIDLFRYLISHNWGEYSSWLDSSVTPFAVSSGSRRLPPSTFLLAPVPPTSPTSDLRIVASIQRHRRPTHFRHYFTAAPSISSKFRFLRRRFHCTIKRESQPDVLRYFEAQLE
ncbi:unnamed protein product [Lactuca virosa]|uniref:Uncharacterized protein n=1 Tax=Lactuca virosa TaxID=75947 RepID=A0AAU9M2C4_9ASTR|nr:unnamed protein product [Lactuca virosa]